MRPLLGSLVLILTFALDAAAGIWGERGISRRFLIEGERLYVADGRGAAVYAIGDPSSLRRLDAFRTEDESYDVALMGASDLVVATRAGVVRLAVAPDGRLTPRSGFDVPGGVLKIAASPQHVAAASGQSVLILQRSGDSLLHVRTLTASQPIAALTFVDSYLYLSVDRQATYVYEPAAGTLLATVAGVLDFARSGTTLWGISPGQGLVAIDVRRPEAPQNLTVAAESPLALTAITAASGRLFALEPPRKIHLFDAPSAAESKYAGAFEHPVEVLAARGMHLFVSAPILDADGLRYESGVPVRALDVMLPAAPVVAGEFRDLAGPVSGVWTNGSLAYVVDPPFFRVLDVSRTEAPVEVASLQLPADAQERVRVKDGMAIVYGRGFVHLIDVSRPLQPVHAGTWNTRGRYPSDAALLTNATFVEANKHSGLHIVDHSNPAAAHQIGGRIWHYISVAAGADAVYALQEGGFLALQVANRNTVVDRHQLAVSATQIETAPPNADHPDYVATRGVDGVRIFSLEDRFAPREIAHLPHLEAQVIGGGEGLLWFAQWGTIGRLDLPAGNIHTFDWRVTSPLQMSVANGKVVVADRYSVRVYGPDTESPGTVFRLRRRAVGQP